MKVIMATKEGREIVVGTPDGRFLATIILQMDGDMLKVVEHEGVGRGRGKDTDIVGILA